MDFGFTNNAEEFKRTVAWRDAAVADGWSIEPTYPDHESAERAASLVRDGFKASVISRENDGKRWRFEANVHVWGPDRLAIKPGRVYDWERIVACVRTCPECKTEDVDTERVGFANRACADCAPALRAKIETPGWCD